MSGGGHDSVKAELSRIRQAVARLADDRWGHEASVDGERIVVMRAVFDSEGRKVGYEQPMVLLSFGPHATLYEKQMVRDAVTNLAFVLGQLGRAGEMIRDLRKQVRGGAGSASGQAAAFPSPERGEGGPEGLMRGESDAPNLAAEASIKCIEPAFQRYLSERHATDDDGDLSDTAFAAAVLRRALGIGSRKDLNTDADAAQKWHAMRADFQEWMRG